MTSLPPEGTVEEVHEVVPCSCRCRFCDRCGRVLGWKLRRRILAWGAIREFRNLQMWTLTLDPELFASPVEAHQYTRDKRCVSRLVRELDRLGYLGSRHYFCAIEFQRNGMVHFHLLIDAKTGFIPFDAVTRIWNKFRPKEAGPVQGERPGFGSVRFSVPQFASPEHAINYATKYCVKPPKDGWPDWVWESRKNITRYTTSRGFWADEPKRPQRDPDEGSTLNDDWCDDGPGPDEEDGRTVRDRVDNCRQAASIVKTTTIHLGGGEVAVYKTFLGQCVESYPTLVRAEGLSDPNSIPISAARLPELLGKTDVEESKSDGRSGRSGSQCSRHERGESNRDGPSDGRGLLRLVRQSGGSEGSSAQTG